MIISTNKNNQIAKKIIKITDVIFSLLILLSIVALIIYSGATIYKLFIQVTSFENIQIIHNIAYIIVLLKAYKILTFYLQYHNLSIKYLSQIAIIAPAIEVIFAADQQSFTITILFATYSVISLIIYLIFYNKLNQLDEDDRAIK